MQVVTMQSGVTKFIVFAVSIGCALCEFSPVCKVNQFACPNEEKCIRMIYRCDGDGNPWSPGSHYCSDFSDEADCGISKCSGLKCNDGGCIDQKRFCDEIPDCIDYSDEKDCGYQDSDLIFLNEGIDIYMKKRTKAGLEFTHLVPISSRMKRTGYHNGMKITGLSFDVGNWTLFISDAGRPAILAVNVTSLNTRYLVHENITFPVDVAFDWSSNNLYWLDSVRGTAEVVTVDTLRRTIIVTDLTNPVALALSPNSGTMFIATVGFESYIFMYGMDGSNRRTLDSVIRYDIASVSMNPTSLVVHPMKSFLFWTDPSEGTIFYVNYSSISQPKILKNKIGGLMAVTVTERDIYFTSGETHRLYSERANRIKIPGYDKDEGWKSITFGIKPSGKSECLIENGGCDHICLTSEFGRTCVCPSDKTLGEDGKSC